MVFSRFRRERAKVVFSNDYIYGLTSVGKYQSFDVLRFKKIRDRLVKEKLLRRQNILKPKPCDNADLHLVHTDKYIRQIQDPQFASQLLQLADVDLFYNSILEFYKAVTGGTLLATSYALKWNIPVFNLGGGYHHAHPDRGEGFCLVNDIAIAIEKFRALRRSHKFMIIDLDYHQGNGNLLYFKEDEYVFTFSIHADTWVEIDRNHNRDILIDSNTTDEQYMQLLDNELDEACMQFKPDMVFYIAGSDVYEKDTLADMKLSRAGILRRNLYVYNRVRNKNLPLVILAGGGYGPDSWEVYYDFIAHVLNPRKALREID